MKFFLAGHVGFYNRGCEALVRSIVMALEQRLGPSEFIVPSNDIGIDSQRWPEAPAHGVKFIPFYPIPDAIKWWDRVVRRAPAAADYWWPLPELPASMAGELAQCDMVIVTGGDVLSLDYMGASLLRWVAQAESAMRRDIPVALWASSIGPFNRNLSVERRMIRHLDRYAVLSSRESHSQAYMDRLGLPRCVQTADPAFLLKPQPLDVGEFMPADATHGVLGFNVSPVMARSLTQAGGSLARLEADIVQFWRSAVRDHGMSVALIPHVDSPDGQSEQSDTGYMQRLLGLASDLGPRVRLVPPTLNAAQLKSILAACTCFIGARTHATIGAMSSGVPTMSIAYSVKAKGINQDLFGHLKYLIETPSVSRETLGEGLQRLVSERADIARSLAERVPKVRRKSLSTADLVAAALTGRRAAAVA